MLKYFIVITGIMLGTFGFAQQTDGQYIHKHLLRSDLSITGGSMFKNNFKNVYIDGNLEYYIDNKISIRGISNFLVGSTGLNEDSVGLKDNHTLGLGVAYHFHTNSHLDPYFVFQPGLAYTSSYKQLQIPNLHGDGPTSKHYYPGTVSPYASAGLGINYYFEYVAHLFIEARYVHETHLANDAPKPLSLDEVRITFGLGFNLFIIKDKKKPV